MRQFHRLTYLLLFAGFVNLSLASGVADASKSSELAPKDGDPENPDVKPVQKEQLTLEEPVETSEEDDPALEKRSGPEAKGKSTEHEEKGEESSLGKEVHLDDSEERQAPARLQVGNFEQWMYLIIKVLNTFTCLPHYQLSFRTEKNLLKLGFRTRVSLHTETTNNDPRLP